MCNNNKSIVDYGALMLIEEHKQIERQKNRTEEDTHRHTLTYPPHAMMKRNEKHDANTKPNRCPFDTNI